MGVVKAAEAPIMRMMANCPVCRPCTLMRRTTGHSKITVAWRVTDFDWVLSQERGPGSVGFLAAFTLLHCGLHFAGPSHTHRTLCHLFWHPSWPRLV